MPNRVFVDTHYVITDFHVNNELSSFVHQELMGDKKPINFIVLSKRV